MMTEKGARQAKHDFPEEASVKAWFLRRTCKVVCNGRVANGPCWNDLWLLYWHFCGTIG